MGTGVGQRGRIAQHVGNPDLRRARQQRGWTEDDVAVRLHELAGELGEPTPGVSGPQVGKWERGVRSPGRYYRPRLCLVFEAMPRRSGWFRTRASCMTSGSWGGSGSNCSHGSKTSVPAPQLRARSTQHRW